MNVSESKVSGVFLLINIVFADASILLLFGHCLNLSFCSVYVQVLNRHFLSFFLFFLPEVSVLFVFLFGS